MLFAIRDDDISYFTTPEQIEEIYNEIWDICPISFSMVPFHGCTKTGAIPQEYWEGEQMFPIGKNRLLVDFLTEKIRNGKVCITLHGHNHKDNPDGYEFETGINLVSKVRDGKKYLEKLFGCPIRVFVPPHNRVSKEGLRAVIKNNLHLANVPPFRHRDKFLHASVIIPSVRRLLLKCRHRGKPYPFVLNFGDHKELQCHGLVPRTQLQELLKKFEFCYQMNGAFVLAAHYWEYDAPCINHEDSKMKDVLFRFWDIVRKRPNVRFVTLNQLFEEKA